MKNPKTPKSTGRKREAWTEEELKKVGIAAEKRRVGIPRPITASADVFKPLSEEEVHEQSKIITSDKMKRKYIERERERERENALISVSVRTLSIT